MSSKTLTKYEYGIHARNAVWASFFVLGITGMAWIPRIPEIKSSLGLSDGQFGLLLLASTFGAVPGAQLSGRIVHIDFGDCWEVLQKRDEFPEKVPFRLTRMLT